VRPPARPPRLTGERPRCAARTPLDGAGCFSSKGFSMLRCIPAALLTAALVAAPASPLVPSAAAQGAAASVSATDIQRLSLALGDAEAEVERAIDRKPDLASRYNKEL